MCKKKSKILILFLLLFFITNSNIIFAKTVIVKSGPLVFVSNNNHKTLKNALMVKMIKKSAAPNNKNTKNATTVNYSATKKINKTVDDRTYLPYTQFSGTHLFNINESNAAVGELFVPIWQRNLTDLAFADVRLNDRTGVAFEGNIHVGYRHMSPETQKLYGIYASFDRKKTGFGNYFNQITVGGEHWIDNWFIGGNIYQPIGKKSKSVGAEHANASSKDMSYKNACLAANNLLYEKAMPGADTEVGYEFVENLTGYAGVYYFKSSDVDTVFGPRARLTYDWYFNNYGKISGVVEKVGLEVGIQKDRPRGTVWYLSANARIGLSPERRNVAEGVYRHMVDPIRRDVDVVVSRMSNITSRTMIPDNPATASVKIISEGPIINIG